MEKIEEIGNLEVQNYNFRKIIFPKTINIKNPGIIISKSFHYLNNAKTMRLVYTFEDFWVDLYGETIKQIGEIKAKKLWYGIGKEIGFRYFSFIGKKNISPSKFFQVLQHFCRMFIGIGISFCEKLQHDFNQKRFVFFGKEIIVCTKANNFSFIEGLIFGILSSLFHEEFDVKSIIDVNAGKYKFVAIATGQKSALFEKDFISKEYSLNFKRLNKFNSGLYTFSDLLKFGLINFDNKNRISLLGNALILSEIGLVDIFVKHYAESKNLAIFEENSSNFMNKLCDNFTKVLFGADRLRFFRNIMSAFGFGEIYFQKKNNLIKVDFLNPIYTCYFGPSFIDITVKAFLKYFYKKEFILIKKFEKQLIFSEA